MYVQKKLITSLDINDAGLLTDLWLASKLYEVSTVITAIYLLFSYGLHSYTYILYMDFLQTLITIYTFTYTNILSDKHTYKHQLCI